MARYTIDTNTPVTPVAKKKTPLWKRKTVWLVAVVFIVAGLMAWRVGGAKPDVPTDPTALRQFMATPEFSQLTEEQKRPYFQAMRSGFMRRMEEQMTAYFALPPGPQRDRYMDGLIDQMEKRQQEWQARAATRPARPPGDAGPASSSSSSRRNMTRPERMKARVENTPPATKARMAEFRKAMEDRRAQRGLPPSPWGR